jgi:MoxR-like ATPase
LTELRALGWSGDAHLKVPKPLSEAKRSALNGTVCGLRSKLRQLLSKLATSLFERDSEIRLSILCALAGEHIMLLGPPGVGKSMIASRVAKALCGPKVPIFDYLMTKFSNPSEIFGPYSLLGLEKDELLRRPEGYLPRAVIGFLDETFKANGAILNALLQVCFLFSHLHLDGFRFFTNV